MNCFVKTLFLSFILITVSSAQTLDDRIEGLISQMTLEEKVKQLHQEGTMNTAANERLNIPGFNMSDGPHGVRNGLATSFPVGIGMAATWDVELAYRVGEAMGKEFRGKGIDQALGPCLDLTLDPRNGRSPESTSEDPFLNTTINTSMVRGIQSNPVLATIKHFYTEYRQNGRTTNNYTLSQRNLLEHHGLQFREAVQVGGALSVMSSYNSLNGFSAAKNNNLLTTVLRDTWGFPFYVVSDWGSIYSNPGQAITAGCDIEMGSILFQDEVTGLVNLVNTGQLSEAIIDNAVRRVLKTKYLSGIMNYHPEGDPNDVNSLKHQQLNLEAGKKSLVLLKNKDNILPLDTSSILKIAVIGPNAAVMQTDASGSSWVEPHYRISPLEGIQKYVGTSKLLYAKGCEISGTTYASDISNAISYASQADVVIFFGGLDGSQEGEGFDRANNSIELPGRQKDLIKTLSSVNPNLIVLLISGGICTPAPFINYIKGLVYGFYPGQEGGNAIAQVLFGDYNPGGKLPVTIPVGDYQMPNRLSDDLDANMGGGYRWFDNKNFIPQYAFGYGLSYSTFELSNLQMSHQVSALRDETITINADVTNTGSAAGEEVLQVYISKKNGTAVHDEKDLIDFKRIYLTPSETKTVGFEITPDRFYYFSEQTNSYEVDPGTYTFYIGNSSDSLPLNHTLELLTSTPKPELQIGNVYTVPRYPLEGDTVIFLATILNRGTGPSPSVNHEITFKLNGNIISRSTEFTGSIDAGGMVLICGNAGDNNVNYWIAGKPGSYAVEAVIDVGSLIQEINENNNSKTSNLQVYNTPAQNLALNKTVVVSSIESSSYPGQYAVDGNLATRWSSLFSDPQTLTLDLGQTEHFNQIKISWETAYGKEYFIDISQDSSTWNRIVDQKNGYGGVELWNINTYGRFIRLTGVQRATKWGYSIYEFQVFNLDSLTSVYGEKENRPLQFSLFQNYPNPFNPVTTIKFQLPSDAAVSLKIFDLLGAEAAVLLNEEKHAGSYEIKWNADHLPSGVYFYQLKAGSLTETRKMVLMK